MVAHFAAHEGQAGQEGQEPEGWRGAEVRIRGALVRSHSNRGGGTDSAGAVSGTESGISLSPASTSVSTFRLEPSRVDFFGGALPSAAPANSIGGTSSTTSSSSSSVGRLGHHGRRPRLQYEEMLAGDGGGNGFVWAKKWSGV